jgi:hypothetical protein
LDFHTLLLKKEKNVLKKQTAINIAPVNLHDYPLLKSAPPTSPRQNKNLNYLWVYFSEENKKYRTCLSADR